MSKFKSTLKEIFPFSLSLFVALSLCRIFQIISENENIYGVELKTEYHVKGFIMDLMAAMLISILGIIFGLLVQSISKKVIKLPMHLFSVFGIMLNYVLTYYFILTNQLVGDAFYQMSANELLITSSFTSYITTNTIVFSISMLLTYFVLGKVFMRIRVNNWVKYTYLFFLLGASVAYPWKVISSNDYVGDIVINNKLIAFVGLTESHFFSKKELESVNRNEYLNLDDRFFPDPEMKGNMYPLLHDLPEQSSLSTFVNTSADGPPNIKIIIVESMSSFLIGNNEDNPCHFMPFLDSMAKNCLYFPNFMSTCERTHNVLPATLASTPNPPDRTFTQSGELPYHLSLMSLLKDYRSSFYCGVDLNFVKMNLFMGFNQTDYLVHSWESKFSKTRDGVKSFWGYADDELFEKSYLEDKKSTEKKPKLDVFLTISTHEPYCYPNKSRYVERANEHLKKYPSNQRQKNEIKQHIEAYAGYLFVDDVLKKYFDHEKKQPNYKNTIYFIYGDHGCSSFPRNVIQKYQTPLFIISPLVKKAKVFQSMNSHLDLTPTIINFLRINYPDLSLNQNVPFIGKELDFKMPFSCDRALPLITTDSETKHLIFKNHYYYDGQLFRILPGMKLKQFSDNDEKEKLKNQLERYKKLTRYLHENNKIIPEILFEKNTDWGKKHILFDTLSEKWEYDKNNDFINVGPGIGLNKKWKQIEVVFEGECYLDKSESVDDIPPLVEILENKSKKKISNYVTHPIQFVENFKKNKWSKFRYRFYIDLRETNRSSKKHLLSYYLYNLEKSKIRFRKCKTRICAWE